MASLISLALGTFLGLAASSPTAALDLRPGLAACERASPAVETLGPGVTVFRGCVGRERASVAHVAEIDLTAASFGFVATTGNGAAPREFFAAATSQFAQETNAVVAVNGGYFEPFVGGGRGAPAYPQPGDPVDVAGWHIAEGVVVSDAAIANLDYAARVNGVFCVEDAQLAIRDARCQDGATEALGGGPILVRDGARAPLDAVPEGFVEALAPRTALALADEGHTLLMIVVDGRQPEYSRGVSLRGFANVLIALGAEEAINLDGGGSSVLVGPQGRILSRPIDAGVPGRERVVANHLGVRLASAAEDDAP